MKELEVVKKEKAQWNLKQLKSASRMLKIKNQEV
jgi:hypothetical protein